MVGYGVNTFIDLEKDVLEVGDAYQLCTINPALRPATGMKSPAWLEIVNERKVKFIGRAGSGETFVFKAFGGRFTGAGGKVYSHRQILLHENDYGFEWALRYV